MSEKDKKQLKAEVLMEITEALLEGAPEPCGYWYKKLAERLADRAKRILHKE